MTPRDRHITAEEDFGVDPEDQLSIEHHGDPHPRATEVTPET